MCNSSVYISCIVVLETMFRLQPMSFKINTPNKYEIPIKCEMKTNFLDKENI